MRYHGKFSVLLRTFDREAQRSKTAMSAIKSATKDSSVHGIFLARMKKLYDKFDEKVARPKLDYISVIENVKVKQDV